MGTRTLHMGNKQKMVGNRLTHRKTHIQLERRMTENQKLYHIEIIDQDGEHWVEWCWATNQQHAQEQQNPDPKTRYEIREATLEETSAWEDGWGAAIGIGLAEERMANWNGITYRIDSLFPLETKQQFQCALCQQTYDIEHAAKLGNLYLSVKTPKEEQENKTILWHTCKTCASQ